MEKTLILFVYVLVTSFLGGCINSSYEEETLLKEELENFSLHIDEEVYQIPNGETNLVVAYTLINNTRQNLYPGSCLGAFSDILEKQVDGEWVIAYEPVCPDILQSPIKVEPGATYDALIHLSIPTSGSNNVTWKVDDIEGEYRVREKIFGTWDMAKYQDGSLQSEVIVSNTFEINQVQ